MDLVFSPQSPTMGKKEKKILKQIKFIGDFFFVPLWVEG
jgi:hypothetical protein